MAIFDSVIDVLVPRDSSGRVRLDGLPRPPAKRPECIIVRDTMARAWYAALISDDVFRADFLALLDLDPRVAAKITLAIARLLAMRVKAYSGRLREILLS